MKAFREEAVIFPHGPGDSAGMKETMTVKVTNSIAVKTVTRTYMIKDGSTKVQQVTVERDFK